MSDSDSPPSIVPRLNYHFTAMQSWSGIATSRGSTFNVVQARVWHTPSQAMDELIPALIPVLTGRGGQWTWLRINDDAVKLRIARYS